MSSWLLTHWYLLAGALVAAIGAALVALTTSRQRKDGAPSLLSYLMVWPLIFEQEAAAKKKTRLAFVVVGVVIGLFLIVVGIAINPGRR